MMLVMQIENFALNCCCYSCLPHVSVCRTKALVLELLAAVCLVAGGHELIVNAFTHFKKVRQSILLISHK